MELEGTVWNVLPPVRGTSARGEWVKQEVVFEQPGEFNRKVCVSFWGDKAQDAATLKPGEAVTISATSSRASTTDAGSPKCGHGGSCVRPLSSLSRRPCRTACRRSTRSPRSRLLRARLRRWTICLSKDGVPTGYIAETVRKRATVCSLSYRLSFPARLPVLCRVRIRVACLRRAGSEPGKEQAGSDMKR